MEGRPAAAAGALSGRVFALSASGVNQSQLAAEIQRNGGRFSRTVHKRVDFLVVTREAVRRDTQPVRKVRRKFTGVQMVLPEFVHDSARAGAICDPATYAPEPHRKAGSVETAQPAGSSGQSKRVRTLAEIDLIAGQQIEVLVEMDGDPPVVWWPATVKAPTPGAVMGAHPIEYISLPSRGYPDVTPSRARFERASDGDAPIKADGKLYDLDEGVWRPWRRLAPAGRGSVRGASAKPPSLPQERRVPLGLARDDPYLQASIPFTRTEGSRHLGEFPATSRRDVGASNERRTGVRSLAAMDVEAVIRGRNDESDDEVEEMELSDESATTSGATDVVATPIAKPALPDSSGAVRRAVRRRLAPSRSFHFPFKRLSAGRAFGLSAMRATMRRRLGRAMGVGEKLERGGRWKGPLGWRGWALPPLALRFVSRKRKRSGDSSSTSSLAAASPSPPTQPTANRAPHASLAAMLRLAALERLRVAGDGNCAYYAACASLPEVSLRSVGLHKLEHVGRSRAATKADLKQQRSLRARVTDFVQLPESANHRWVGASDEEPPTAAAMEVHRRNGTYAQTPQLRGMAEVLRCCIVSIDSAALYDRVPVFICGERRTVQLRSWREMAPVIARGESIAPAESGLPTIVIVNNGESGPAGHFDGTSRAATPTTKR